VDFRRRRQAEDQQGYEKLTLARIARVAMLKLSKVIWGILQAHKSLADREIECLG
jgi:hypothetical protein